MNLIKRGKQILGQSYGNMYQTQGAQYEIKRFWINYTGKKSFVIYFHFQNHLVNLQIIIRCTGVSNFSIMDVWKKKNWIEKEFGIFFFYDDLTLWETYLKVELVEEN